jgi:hypothetical protein
LLPATGRLRLRLEPEHNADEVLFLGADAAKREALRFARWIFS